MKDARKTTANGRVLSTGAVPYPGPTPRLSHTTPYLNKEPESHSGSTHSFCHAHLYALWPFSTVARLAVARARSRRQHIPSHVECDAGVLHQPPRQLLRQRTKARKLRRYFPNP